MSAAQDRATALLGQAQACIAGSRLRAARALLAAAQALGVAPAAAREAEWRILSGEGRAAEARALLDAALRDDPGDVPNRLRRADALLAAGDHHAACADAAAAVLARPDLPAARAMLGRALVHAGRLGEARPCLEEAVRDAPGDPQARLSLTHCLVQLGDAAAAQAVLEAGLLAAPRHVGLRSAAILLHLQCGRFARAEALADAARRDGVADACILGLLGHARSSLGDHARAADAYAEARKLAPDDPYVAHLAAAAGLSPAAGRASPDYVRTVFDGYAKRFDAHLVSLGYRIPGLLRAEVERLLPPGAAPVPALDLGCGTGLVAVALSGLPLAPLVGVDLSAAMLAKAAERALYDELRQGDIEAFLREDGRQFQFVFAADVLPYLGDLSPICGQIARALRPGGQAWMSVERADADAGEWRLGRLGRYQHAPAHVRRAAAEAGLEVIALRDEVIRLEIVMPVAGLLVGLRRPMA